MEDKFAWIISPDLDWNEKKEFITTSLESGIGTVLDLMDIENIKKVGYGKARPYGAAALR